MGPTARLLLDNGEKARGSRLLSVEDAGVPVLPEPPGSEKDQS